MAMFEGKTERVLREFDGKKIEQSGHIFTLHLIDKNPIGRPLERFRWNVELEDGTTFEVAIMENTLIEGHPKTRLDSIIYQLKKENKYHEDYLANVINDKIDEICGEAF